MRVLNVTSMLSAYQAELFDVMTEVPDTSVWDDNTTITDYLSACAALCCPGCGEVHGNVGIAGKSELHVSISHSETYQNKCYERKSCLTSMSEMSHQNALLAIRVK